LVGPAGLEPATRPL